jgi:hypothetical protein
MQRFKVRFVENRLIFEKPVEAPKKATSAPEAPKDGASEVRAETERGLAEARTQFDLEALKSKLGVDKFGEFLKATSLDGQKYSRSISKDKLDFLDDSYLISLAGEILASLEGKGDFKSLAETLGADESEVKEVISNIYARSFLKMVKAEFDEAYPRFSEFVASNPAGIDFKDMRFDISPNAQGGAKVDLNIPEGVKTAYETYVKTHPVEVPKKPAGEADEPKAPEDEATIKARQAKERDERIAELKKSPIGKLLGMFGFNEVIEGKTGFEKIIDNESPLGSFILGLFGYSALAGGGYEGIVDMLPKEFQDKVKKWEKKARESKFGSRALEEAAEKSLAVLDASGLQEIIKGKKPFPEKGFKLKSEYSLGVSGRAKALKVNLTKGKGGEIILPEGSSLRIDDQPVSVEKGKVRKYDSSDNILTFNDKIPVGTVFKGEIEFTEVKEEVAS